MFLRCDELYVSSETFSLKGWVGGFLPLSTENFSSFIGVCCAVRAMEKSEDNPGGHSSADVSNVGLDNAPFISFADDLQIMRSEGGQTNMDASDDYMKNLFGSIEPMQSEERLSVCSPTTVATQDVYGGRGSDFLQATGSTDSHGHDSANSFNFDAALNVAFNSTESEQPKQVWETGIWKYIFGGDSSGIDFGVWGEQMSRPTPSLWGVDQQVLDTDQGGSLKRSRMHSCNFMDVVSFKPDVPWPEQRDADLQRGIMLWTGVTSKWNEGCSLVVKVADMRSEAEVFNMFAHVFSGRAPVTVRKRGTAILRVCNYLESNSLELFPMKEITFYRFLCHEQLQGAPASRLQGYMQAIAFCRHVLDVQELQAVLDSKRCSGVSRETCPRERKQASPLTVVELRRLHQLVDEAPDIWDAIFAGAALLCCYCRGRWGDLMRSESAFLDVDENRQPAYLETRTGRHKTMSSQMHRHQFLPMVAPVKGVHGADWTTPWMKHRTSMGLAFPPEGLIMPAPDKNGEPTQRPLESGECGKWLRCLLSMDKDTSEGSERRISSHSLKCTMLSFAAKRGLSVPDRLMLGYHSSQMHMAMVYSRDGAAASLILLERLIEEIFKGKFKPDSTRSGRVIDSPAEPPGPQQDVVKVEQVLSSDEERNDSALESNSSDSTSSSDSSAEEVLKDHSLNEVFATPRPPEGFSRWQHSKLKTVHLTEPGYFRVFVCGRSVGAFHQRLTPEPRFDSPICWACFKKANGE